MSCPSRSIISKEQVKILGMQNMYEPTYQPRPVFLIRPDMKMPMGQVKWVTRPDLLLSRWVDFDSGVAYPIWVGAGFGFGAPTLRVLTGRTAHAQPGPSPLCAGFRP